MQSVNLDAGARSPNAPCGIPRRASSRSCAWTTTPSSTSRSSCRAGPTSSPSSRPPAARKILGNILGLEAWEIYRERAARAPKNDRTRAGLVDGRVAEIDAELGEEEPARRTWPNWKSQLKAWPPAASCQEAVPGNVETGAAALDRQRAAGRQTWARPWSVPRRTCRHSRPGWRETDRTQHSCETGGGAEVEAAYASLADRRRLDLEKWEQVAERFREHDQRRQPLLRGDRAGTRPPGAGTRRAWRHMR